MSRVARLKVNKGKDCWYFLYSNILPTIRNGALSEEESGDRLLSIIKLNAKAFECDLAGVFISKYHYSLVVKFRKFEKLSQQVLSDKAIALYNGKQEKFWLWNENDWSNFNDRLFKVGEFMRSIKLSFASWSNCRFGLKGSNLWIERFKSTILTNDASALDALLYVESGPIREKDSTGLDYKYSSYSLRSSSKSDWLMPIEGNFGFAKDIKCKADYEQMLNHRVNLPANSKDIVAQEIKNGYEAGCYLNSQKYFLNGLVIGAEKEIQSSIDKYNLNLKMKKESHPLRKTKPYKLKVGNQYSFIEQRRH